MPGARHPPMDAAGKAEVPTRSAIRDQRVRRGGSPLGTQPSGSGRPLARRASGDRRRPQDGCLPRDGARRRLSGSSTNTSDSSILASRCRRSMHLPPQRADRTPRGLAGSRPRPEPVRDRAAIAEGAGEGADEIRLPRPPSAREDPRVRDRNADRKRSTYRHGARFLRAGIRREGSSENVHGLHRYRAARARRAVARLLRRCAGGRPAPVCADVEELRHAKLDRRRELHDQLERFGVRRACRVHRRRLDGRGRPRRLRRHLHPDQQQGDHRRRDPERRAVPAPRRGPGL